MEGQVRLLEEIKVDFGRGDSALGDWSGETDPEYKRNVAALAEVILVDFILCRLRSQLKN